MCHQETKDQKTRGKSARGNMAKAARALGISERIVGLRVKKYDITTRPSGTKE